ncbi:MAG: PEP-CTERM sorting domain-containing protein [Pseudomonadota bacterium]
MRRTVLAATTALILASGGTQAALHDRGGGLLYDDVLNVTWLQDANYAKTSGYDADGRMNWNAANTWAADLVYHDSVRNVDYGDWRLAASTPVGATWNFNMSNSGSTDSGQNITSPHSELSYMYYVDLGLKSYYSPTDTLQPDFGIFGNGSSFGQKDVGLVKNLQSWIYWIGMANAPIPANYSPSFSTMTGQQGYFYEPSELSAWAVRPGDVAPAAPPPPIPEPETYALLLAGLGMIGFMARRRA